MDKKLLNSSHYRRDKKGHTPLFLGPCENQCLLAEYPTPLWILPQYKGEADGEIMGTRRGRKKQRPGCDEPPHTWGRFVLRSQGAQLIRDESFQIEIDDLSLNKEKRLIFKTPFWSIDKN